MVKTEQAPKKSTPNKTGKSAKPTAKQTAAADDIAYQRNLFVMMVLGMSWQLALVVIIPIVGSYYLDSYFHTFPGLFIAGIIVAALGIVGVMIRVVNEANKRTGLKK